MQRGVLVLFANYTLMSGTAMHFGHVYALMDRAGIFRGLYAVGADDWQINLQSNLKEKTVT